MGIKNNPGIKRTGEATEYTPEQVLELKKCAEDPVHFIKKYARIQHPVKGAVAFELYPYQERMVRAYKENRYSVVLSARQTGKALRLNEPIPTPTGWTTMGEIAVGDQVLDADGEPTTVTFATEVMYNHDCYRVEFSNGESVVADKDHLWKVTDEYTKKTKVLKTSDMLDAPTLTNNKNQARFTVTISKPLRLPTQKLDVDPYTLGVWLGDKYSTCGWITHHQEDFSIIENIIDGGNWKTRSFNLKDKEHFQTTYVYGLHPLLKKIGVSTNKHIPVEYLRSSYNQRLSLLQGLMDAAGTVHPGGSCNITLANKQLIDDTYELLLTMGLNPTIKKIINFNSVVWSIEFIAYSSEIKVFQLERKLNKMKVAPHPAHKFSTKKRSIQNIVKVDSVPVRCIQVDNPHHLFLAGRGMIPTHNSTVSAIYLLWFAMFNFDKTILIAANKNANAIEMVARIRYAYEHIPNWLKPGVTDDGWNKHSLIFDNNSRILSAATSESTGRGFAISLLFLDEFAFVQPGIQEEFWTSISPTLSTGGSCIMSSTPNGDSNKFAQIWRSAEVGRTTITESEELLEDDKINKPKKQEAKKKKKKVEFPFVPIRVKWDEPPGRDEEFKQNEIATLGELKWRQEYECEFLSSDALLIDSQLSAMMDINRMPLLHTQNDFRFYDKIVEKDIYLIGVDPSTGTGQDFSVVQVYHFPSMVQVAEFRSNTMSSPEVYSKIKWIIAQLEQEGCTVYFSVENNGVGEGIIALYQNDESPSGAEMISEEGKKRYGMTTTNKKKMRACLDFRLLVERGGIQINSSLLIKEVKTFARKGRSYEAQTGSTDDCIMATLICVRLLTEIASYEQAAFDKLFTVDENEYTSDEKYDENDEPMPMTFGDSLGDMDGFTPL